MDVVEGFHTTVLPIRAGDIERFDAMEVKLNGVSAKMKPSRGRYSTLLIWLGPLLGWMP